MMCWDDEQELLKHAKQVTGDREQPELPEDYRVDQMTKRLKNLELYVP